MSFCKANGFSTLGDNARILAGLVQEDRAVYLAHRRLFVVRVPELHTALETMVSMPTGVDLAPLREQILIATAELSELANSQTEARHNREVTKAVTGLRLSGGILASLPQTGPDQTLATKASGLIGAAVKGLRDGAVSASSAPRAYVSLAAAVGKHALLANTNLIVMPIRARARALHFAIEQGVGVAVIGGVLATVLFPPALPFAIGLAYLSAGDHYFKALDQTLSEEEQMRKLREQGASEEVAKALAAVRGQRVIRLESARLEVEVDLATNQIDGTILAGRYTGTRLSEHSESIIKLLCEMAPDNQTKQLLERYLAS